MDKNALSKRIGSKVAYWRNQRGLTQDQLAEKIDVTKAYLAHVERGERLFSVPVLCETASVLNVSTDALVSECTLDEDRYRNIAQLMGMQDPGDQEIVEKIMVLCMSLCKTDEADK